MKYVAIIPARGGSKRLPKKNIKNFCGYPLLYFSIISAIRSKHIQMTYVSTDDLEIAEIAEKYGANVIIRPSDFAGDTSTTTSALVHALSIIKNSNLLPEAVITLQPTNPLRKFDLIDNAITLFEENKESIDSLITVSENKHKLGKIEEGMYQPVSYNLEQRSQDLAKLYYENGLLYITKTDVLLKTESVFGDKVFPYITESVFGNIDIDTIDDFELGELVFEKYKHLLKF